MSRSEHDNPCYLLTSNGERTRSPTHDTASAITDVITGER